MLRLQTAVQQYLEGCITAAELQAIILMAAAEINGVIQQQQQDLFDTMNIRPDEGTLMKSQMRAKS